MALLSSGAWRRGLALTLGLTLVLSLAPGVVAAEPLQGAGGTVVVGPDETYDSVEAVAGTVIVRGTVTGDVSAAAGTVHITERGQVQGDVSAAAGTVRIDGRVGGDVSAAGGSVEIGESATIGGTLESGAGYLAIDGTVEGDVTAGAETIVLGPGATIGGELRYDAETLTRDPGATVAGGVVRDDSLQSLGPGFAGLTLPTWVGVVYGLLANLLLGAILLALFPAFSTRVAAEATERPLRAGGVGLLTLVAVPLALVLVAVTIVGIPLSLVGALVFGLTVWVAVVYGQYAVGSWALDLVDRPNRWAALVVGLVGFAILGAIPIVGGLFELLAFLLGMGALVLTLRESYRHRRGETDHGRQRTLEESGGDASTA